MMMTWTFKTWLASALLTGMLVAGAALLTPEDSGAEATTTAAEALSPVSQTTTEVAALAEPSTDELAAIVTDARFSVSVLDLDTGASLTYGADQFDTASIVTVDSLVALLSQYEQAGTTMSAGQRAQASAMIERSDNAAATALFEVVGGKLGLDAFNRTIDLDDTEVGDNGNWGLTQTTSGDQITLLQVVFGDDSVLSSASQDFLQDLMSNVIDSQNFGVSAAADDPDESALKVGYLQRSATGLWDVTSIGRIEANGHTYLVSVLSDGSASFADGVALVDRVARAAVQDMTAI